MRIALAYNPFDKNETVLKKAQGLIKLFKPTYVEIVYIAAPSEPGLSLAYDVPEKKRYSEYPAQEIQKQLKKARFNVNQITILKVASVSKSAQSLELAKYLKRKKFDFTVLSTHARKGLDRFFQGSFAESMILHHKSPLLLFNPSCQIPKSIHQILFGHDLSKTADKNLLAVHQLSKRLKSKVCALYISEPVYNGAEANGFYFTEAYKAIFEERESLLKESLRKVDPSISYTIDQSWMSCSDIFLKQIKKSKANLIVMNSKINSVVAALGGSVTRQVVRVADIPVLVLTGK